MAIVQQEQFDDIPDGNLDLIDLQSFTNLGKVGMDHWFVDASIAGTIFTFNTYKTDGITGETTLVDSQTQDAGVGADTLSIDSYSMTSIDDNNLYSIFAVRANDIASGNTVFSYYITYSTDKGVTWSVILSFGAAVWSGTPPEIAYTKNMFKLNSLFWELYTFDNGSTKFVYTRDFPVASSANVTGITDTAALYQGNVHDNLYYFVFHNGTNFLLYSFNGTSITLEETLSSSLVVPTTWNSDVQKYIRQGSSEVLIDEDHFYYRKIGDLVWGEFSSTAEKMNGIIYTYGDDGNPIVKEILWRFGVYAFEVSGAIGLIQRLDPRDYKKDLITFVQLQGVLFFGDDRYPELDVWTFPTDTTGTIIETLSNHNYYLQIKNTAISKASGFEFIDSHINGTVEIGIYLYETDLTNYIDIGDGIDGSRLCRLKFASDGNMDLLNNAGIQSADVLAYTTGWHYIRIDFIKSGNCTFYYDNNNLGTIAGSAFDATALTLYQEDIMTVGYDSISLSWLGGELGKIKPISAYVGWDNWFTDGNNKLYLLDWRTFVQNKCEIAGALYQKPTAEILSINRPFKDQYLKIYNKYFQPVTHGFVLSNEDVTWEFKYEMESGIAVDFREKINESYTDKTTDYVLRDIIDKYCKFVKYGKGTNGKVNIFTPEQAGGSADDWTNSNGIGCTSTHLKKKQFVNGIMTDVLDLFDNSANSCRTFIENQKFTTYSIKLATDDVTDQYMNIEFRETASRMGALFIVSGNIYWFDGGAQLLQSVSIDTIYHVALVFDTDAVDIYINGDYNSTQGLENNITTTVNRIDYVTSGAINPGIIDFSDMYLGTSLVEAMNTYDSISPLPTELRTISFNNKTLPDVMKWASNTEGFMCSIRPDGQFYFDQFAPGYIDNPDENFVDWGTYKTSPFNIWDYKTGLHGQNCLQWGTYDNPDYTDIPNLSPYTFDVKEIVYSQDNHKDVLHLVNAALGLLTITYTESSTLIVETWVKPVESVINDAVVFSCVDDPLTTTRCGFRLENGIIYNRNNNDTNDTGETYVNNVWIHFKIEYESGVTNKLYLNNALIYTEGSPASGTVEQILVGVQDSEAYFDGIGIVGVDDYVVGDNSYAKDWKLENGTDCNISVISIVQDKYDVIKLDDQNANAIARTYLSFDNTIVSGDSYDFWISLSDAALGFNLFITNSSSDIIVYLRILSDQFQAYYSAAWNNIVAVEDNKPIKGSVVFGTDTFTLILNGVSFGPFTSGMLANADRILISTHSGNTGYQVYFTDLGFSWDEYTKGSRALQYLDDQVTGSTVEPIIKNQNTGFSRIVIFGGFSAGQPLKSIVLGEPSLGSWYDWFSEINNQTDLDALSAKIAADKLVTVRKSKTGLVNQGIIYSGTYIDLTLSSYNILNQIWLTLSEHYDARIDETRFVMADSYYSPSAGESDQRVNENTERTRNNEQNIGEMESKHQTNKTSMITIPADDTTPNVNSGSKFTTSANTIPTLITDLDNPIPGQEITIFGGSTDANSSTIADSPPFYLSGAWTGNLYDSIRLQIWDATHFVETGRSNV